VIYLLDVNVLLAVGYRMHELYPRAVAWLTSLEEADHLATCSITELGSSELPAVPRDWRGTWMPRSETWSD